MGCGDRRRDNLRIVNGDRRCLHAYEDAINAITSLDHYRSETGCDDIWPSEETSNGVNPLPFASQQRLYACLIGKRSYLANELVSHQRVGGHLRPLRLAAPEESPALYRLLV
ncbi:hypothetical protein EVAR_54007_1 [Eumeta japonica]|uniref:Uncharacterized protein n=1 Tax=Eumeta variegata TaxID=151549 RepID=A0A4C1YTJ9_EUMVA|nr:hypothetical protein EVAR_54007_1 [Eumeta japonica]